MITDPMVNIHKVAMDRNQMRNFELGFKFPPNPEISLFALNSLDICLKARTPSTNLSSHVAYSIEWHDVHGAWVENFVQPLSQTEFSS